MANGTPDLIDRYFAADAIRDTDALVALFSDDASVVDESRTWRGPSEIRAWRDGPASTYEYTVKVLGIESSGSNEYLVRTRVDGNFPGGTVELRHRFKLDAQRILRLEIAS